MAQPKLYDVDFLDFKTEVEVGGCVAIANEFVDMKPKFKAFLTGEVLLGNGEKRLLGLNKTSYKNISSVFGKDTKSWVGKKIEYKGEEKMGGMTGRLWLAVK